MKPTINSKGVKVISQARKSECIIASLRVSKNNGSLDCAAQWLKKAIREDNKMLRDELTVPVVYSHKLAEAPEEELCFGCQTISHEWGIHRDETPEWWQFTVYRVTYNYK